MTTVAATGEVAVAPRRSPWIISPSGDLLFIVAAPLLIMALFLPISWTLPTAPFPLVLVGLCSIGHHLPGFMRVYGDRELMQRYRLRALLFPPVLFATVYWLMQHEMATTTMFVLLWGFWHGLMQIYGFMRIYDAKQGRTERRTARIDWWMCATCFAAMLFWSPSFGRRFIDAGENTGLLYVSLIFSEPVQRVGLLAAAAVAVLYVGYTFWMFATGRPVSLLKLLLLAVTAGFLYATWILFETNPWLGLGAWEIFHDVQYFAIVWGYNCHLVNRDVSTRFMRWLFRPRWGLLATYLALVFAYGGSQYLTFDVLEHLLPAVFTTSVILHFYFDGFIWKVRRRKTQRDLGLDQQQPQGNGALVEMNGRTLERIKDFGQLGLIVAPLVLLAVLEVYQPQVELPLRQSLARLVPGSAANHHGLAEAYRRRGRIDAARKEYQLALAEDANYSASLYKLGLLYARQGQVRTASASFRRVLNAEPTNAQAALSIAQLWLAQGRRDHALSVLRNAAESELKDTQSQDPELYDTLARVLLDRPADTGELSQGQNQRLAESFEAVYWAGAACRRTRHRDPHFLLTLATAHAATGNDAEALKAAQRARKTAESLRNSTLLAAIDEALDPDKSND